MSEFANVHNFVTEVAHVLKWRDAIEGEFISGPGYTLHHTAGTLKQRSQMFMDTVCDAVNWVFEQGKSNLRVSNSMGDYIPATSK